VSDVLYFNGRFTTTDERVLGVEDRGFLFGDAIYEVFKFWDKKPVFFREHWQRLVNGLAAIDIPNPWTEETFTAAMRELIDRTEFADGIVYIEISRGDTERSHVWADDLRPTVVAFSRRHKFPDAAQKERGIRLISRPDRRWLHCDVKSVNLLANVIAKKEAQRAGGDEALLVDEGLVRECSHSTFFMVKGGRVVTHPLDCHILPGVTRDRLIALAGGRIEERIIRAEELADADEAFITSTSASVMPVRQIDGGPVWERGPVTAELQRLMDEAELRSAVKM
jgi:D-alanine transaminase